MKSRNKTLYKLIASGIIAAIYAMLTIVLSFIAYGPIQFRVAEVLCILPFFFPTSVWGVFAGCILANIFSPMGLLDMIFGPLATLLAALSTAALGRYAFRRFPDGKGIGKLVCACACAMPVLFNTPIIGAVISYTTAEYAFWPGMIIFGLQVGLGELVVMFLLGYPITRFLLTKDKYMEFFESLR